MADWRDNKYGLEAGYSALNESESFKYVMGAVVLVLVIVGSVVGFFWSIF